MMMLMTMTLNDYYNIKNNQNITTALMPRKQQDPLLPLMPRKQQDPLSFSQPRRDQSTAATAGRQTLDFGGRPDAGPWTLD